MRDAFYLLLKNGIEIVSYILIMYGLWLMVAPLMNVVIKENITRIRRSYAKKSEEVAQDLVEDENKEDTFFKHLTLLMNSTSRNPKSNAAINFVMLSLIIFVSVFSVLIFIIHDLVVALSLALFFGLMPYIIKRVQLNSLRVSTSVELIQVVPLLLQNYQSNGLDIYHALLRTVRDTNNSDMSRILTKLTNTLQTSKSQSELQKGINIFIYSIGTNIGKRLGKQIGKAYTQSSDISPSLSKLEQDIRKLKEQIERVKSENFDTVMLGLLPIVTLPGGIILTKYASGQMDYFKYQFNHPIGIALFIGMLVFSILSIIIAVFLRRPKADL